MFFFQFLFLSLSLFIVYWSFNFFSFCDKQQKVSIHSVSQGYYHHYHISFKEKKNLQRKNLQELSFESKENFCVPKTFVFECLNGHMLLLFVVVEDIFILIGSPISNEMDTAHQSSGSSGRSILEWKRKILSTKFLGKTTKHSKTKCYRTG